MRNNNVLGLLFANMHDENLRELTGARAIGSVPFGGRYRLIDFAMSNLVNAGISKVGVITKRNYQSLMDHIGSGKSWDLSRKNEGLFFLPPFTGGEDYYDGRITSLESILPFLRASKEEYVIISDCYVVGNIDYDRLIEQHIASDADVTVAYKQGVLPNRRNNMVLSLGANHRVEDLAIDVDTAEESLYGIGLYVIGRERLIKEVAEAVSRSRRSFERDVLQRQTDTLRIFGARVPEYTVMISSLEQYFHANMALLDLSVRGALFTPSRPIYTKVRDCAPAVYGLHASVSNSLVADGSTIEGTVNNSILFRDVRVGRGAVLENCIVMQGAVICEKANLTCVISDKNVVIKSDRKLHGFDSYPVFIAKGSMV